MNASERKSFEICTIPTDLESKPSHNLIIEFNYSEFAFICVHSQLKIQIFDIFLPSLIALPPF